jgi:hypothetical protein
LVAERLISMSQLDDLRTRVEKVYLPVAPGGRVPTRAGHGELDSMAFLEFLAGLEQEFGLVFDPEEITESNFATTAATVALIDAKLCGNISKAG